MRNFPVLALALALVVRRVSAFIPTTTTPRSSRNQLLFVRKSTASSSTSRTTPSAPVDSVVVLGDAEAVGAEIRRIVQEAAVGALAERGRFALAIPGGSILKMLVGSHGDWTKDTTLAYVNHKCVAMEDANLATHAKATKLFLKDWKGVNAILLEGTSNGVDEAAAYEQKLRELAASGTLPVNSKGIPVFDLALIGVGDDGHIGSLYPNREEVLVEDSWVLPVAMKEPPSITLSLPVMAAAKQVVVAACGVSDKYPQGKSAGMRRAIVAPDETVTTFPAVGLRGVAMWVMDQAAASQLGDEYNK